MIFCAQSLARDYRFDGGLTTPVHSWEMASNTDFDQSFKHFERRKD